jgi:spermidine synthase
MTTVTFSESHGVRYLHLDSPWIQGAMRLNAPDTLELAYTRQMMVWMLFHEDPHRIVQLGLGAGSLSRFVHYHFPHVQLCVVELNAAVIDACRQRFGLPDDSGRFKVLHADAMAYVSQACNHGLLDVLQVDLYDGNAYRPSLDTPAFYQGCAACLTDAGMMTVNLLGDADTLQSSMDAIAPFFHAICWLPETEDGNVIVMAFKHAPSIDFDVLHERAQRIAAATGLDAAQWVDGLLTWMQEG